MKVYILTIATHTEDGDLFVAAHAYSTLVKAKKSLLESVENLRHPDPEDPELEGSEVHVEKDGMSYMTDRYEANSEVGEIMVREVQ